MMSSLAEGSSEIETGTVQVAEPEIEDQTHPSSGDPANDWLCAWCLGCVASEQDRFNFGGQSEFLFKNPADVVFHIITFSRTVGCRQAGSPTLEHTWFPGHQWSYCLCGGCGMHLGWFYAGPSTFAGLIRERIVRAALVRN